MTPIEQQLLNAYTSKESSKSYYDSIQKVVPNRKEETYSERATNINWPKTLSKPWYPRRQIVNI